MPRFGDQPVSDITRQEVQVYIAHLTQTGYAPKIIDHIHDVLSAVFRTAVKWGHLQDNPAREVDLPTLKTVRRKWALTTLQAALLLEAIPAKNAVLVVDIDVIDICDRLTVDAVCGRFSRSDPAFLVWDSGPLAA